MICLQALERRDDILLIHPHRVGDHTRGLFEAEASVAVSATHAFQDIKIFLFVSHDRIRSFQWFI
jgi:hypothetical protein